MQDLLHIFSTKSVNILTEYQNVNFVPVVMIKDGET